MEAGPQSYSWEFSWLESTTLGLIQHFCFGQAAILNFVPWNVLLFLRNRSLSRSTSISCALCVSTAFGEVTRLCSGAENQGSHEPLSTTTESRSDERDRGSIKSSQLQSERNVSCLACLCLSAFSRLYCCIFWSCSSST
ncbi:hypothetical protein RvY_02315 [Ramazzottius varieornatus]|uniref:Uncharacterized protein n=1 Tax=Ramazzottius varieornatus TaxID=947166 RepID=A0A1D1UJB5_RAMVA|nr:hypothetical protein RvY_02315 [Ramazzottius varieornatus]